MTDITGLREDKRPQSSTIVRALLDRLEAAEKDVALKERVIDALGSELNAVAGERDALRTKLAEMEKQEPVAEIGQQYTLLFAGSDSITGIVKRHGLKVGDKLYALPGAQPAPSVPDVFAWPECPKRRQSHVLFDDGYEEGWAACVATIKAALAAPEAKP